MSILGKICPLKGVGIWRTKDAEGGGSTPFSVSWTASGASWTGDAPASETVVWDASGARWT